MEFIRILVCVISCLFTCVFYAKGSYVTKHYTLNSGLLANDVRTVFVDSNSVLWIGSRSGLSKMVQGEIVASDLALKYQFSNITAIAENNTNELLFASYGQGLLYHHKQVSKIINQSNGLVSDRIRTLFVNQNKAYIGTTVGVSILDLKDFKIQSPTFETTSDEDFEVSGFFEHKGTIYVTTINHGTYVIVQNKLVKVNSIDRIFCVFSKGDYVFYGCQSGLIVENFSTKQIVSKQATPSIHQIKEINGSVFLACAGMFENKGGLFKWDGSKVHLVSEDLNIAASDLLTLEYDKKNAFLYLGSRSTGLYKSHFSKELTYDTSVQNIMALANFNQNIFVFYNKGLQIRNQYGVLKEVSSQVFKNFQENHYTTFKDLAVEKNHFFQIDYSIPADKIIFYKAISDGGFLWVSSNIGMFKLDSSGTLLAYYNIHNYHFDFVNNQLIESNPYGGIRVYSNLQAMQYHYYQPKGNLNIPRVIVDIQQIGQTLYFAGALDGLYTYSQKKGFASLELTENFEEKRIKLLAKGSATRLHVVTDFNDIYCLDISREKVKVKGVISSDELLGGSVNLLEVIDNKLIVGTNKGLIVFTSNGQFYFDEEQGFVNTEVTASVKSNTTLYIGTTKGLYTLDTKYFNARFSNLKVNLTDVFVKGKQYTDNHNDIGELKELRLPYQSNSLQINFAVLGAKYPKKLFFKYRLKPSEEWNEIKSSHINLQYLESGIYPIELKVYDYDSGKETLYSLLYLEIEKPFYFRLWFFIACGLAMVVVTYLMYKNRINILKRKQESNAKKLMYEKRLVEVKLMAVRSQMNSHFIFNVMSSIQFYIIENQPDKAFDYLGDFAKLIRLSLNNSLKERISLQEELDYLQKYVVIENIRFDDRIRFEIIKDTTIDFRSIYIPPMLLQPFVENSLVHAFPPSIKHPLIEVEIKRFDRDIELIVRDNGIGNLSKAVKRHENTSIGMNIVRERMAFIQEYLEEDLVILITEKGTEVVLRLKNIIK